MDLSWMTDALPVQAEAFLTELQIAAEASVKAGLQIAEHYKGEIRVVKKKDRGEIVTQADLDSNEILHQTLSHHFPNDGLVTEENIGDADGNSHARLWLVDPLDGTNDFLAHTGQFCVMVGLAIDKAAKLGVIYRPDTDTLFLGLPEIGAWQIQNPSQKRKLVPLTVHSTVQNPLRFIRSRSHLNPRLKSLEETLGEVEVIPCGSVGVKCLMIAQNQADLYAHPTSYLKEWDTCAPEAILCGAGGIVTDCLGKKLTYGRKGRRQPQGIFAAPKILFDQVKDRVFEIGTQIPAS